MFHHLAQLLSRFCQIPTSPIRIGHTVEQSKIQVNPHSNPNTHLLLEGYPVPDEFLGEQHAVLHVHVLVGHAVHEQEALDVLGALPADQAAGLVPGKVVLGRREPQVPLRVGAR